jgi:hypothetical protein
MHRTGEIVSADVEGVGWVTLEVEVWVMRGPDPLPRSAAHLGVDIHHTIDLHPTPDVVFWGTSPTEVFVHAPEQTPEEEEVAGADALAPQVALSDADLAQSGTPTRRPGQRIMPEVGIEVCAVVGSLSPRGQA